MDYLHVVKDLELKKGLWMTYLQVWGARDYRRLLVIRSLKDYYKLLPWICAAIERQIFIIKLSSSWKIQDIFIKISFSINQKRKTKCNPKIISIINRN